MRPPLIAGRSRGQANARPVKVWPLPSELDIQPRLRWLGTARGGGAARARSELRGDGMTSV